MELMVKRQRLKEEKRVIVLLIWMLVGCLSSHHEVEFEVSEMSEGKEGRSGLMAASGCDESSSR